MSRISDQLSGWELALVCQHPAMFVAWQTVRYAGAFALGTLLVAVASPQWNLAGRAAGLTLLLAALFGLSAGFVLFAVARRSLSAGGEQTVGSSAAGAI